jgi:DNA polymerase III alpha subunit
MKDLGWDKSQPHIDRLKIEIEDIRVALENNKYDFATYFLIVRDFIQQAKNRNILTGCGRGSGYASVLLRALGISYGPDPLKYGLIWERFLGFDTKHFVDLKDFGLGKDFVAETDKPVIHVEEADRDVVDDPGGVDRY